MLGSSHIGKGKLKGETNKWVTTLNALSDLIEEMLKTQRTWMYLEPIFSSGDIATTMPYEAKLFNEVELNNLTLELSGIELVTFILTCSFRWIIEN